MLALGRRLCGNLAVVCLSEVILPEPTSAPTYDANTDIQTMYRCPCQSWSLAATRLNMPLTLGFTAWVAQELIASTGVMKATQTAMAANTRLTTVLTYHLSIMMAPSLTSRAVSLTSQAATFASLVRLRWSGGGCIQRQKSLPIYRAAAMFTIILQTSIWKRRDLRISETNLGRVGGLFDSWEQSNLSGSFPHNAEMS